MRRRGDGAAAAWGYLLPLQDGAPPLELRQDQATVGTLSSCSLHADAAAFGLPPAAAPQVVLELLREDGDLRVRLRSEASVVSVSVNGKPLRRGRDEQLKHGERLSFREDGARYVFVQREESDSFEAPPEVLEKYVVGYSLGAGGFGRVYVLFDKKLGYQRKAMKIVQPRDEKQLQYAEREARILMSLKHPCVITTYSIKRMGQRQFLVMEYLAGGDLTQFVNDQRPLSEAQTKLLFFQLALAVQYLHKRNICHRDLKPENILLQRRDPHSLIKVTDFGLAKDDQDHSSLKTFAGTKPYLAPEVLEEKYTNSVDVWSMGVILFYSLTGALPFRSLDEALRRGHVVKFDPARWRGVSWQAQITVKSMLKVQASDRVSAARVLEDPWLRDDAMREAAFELTGLKEIRPRPTSRPPAAAPPAAPTAATTPTRRLLSPRGVLEYMRVDIAPAHAEEPRRGCLQSLRARPLLLGTVILLVIVVLALIAYALWMYLVEDENVFDGFGQDDSFSNQTATTSAFDGTAQRGPTGRKAVSSALPTEGAGRSRTA